MSLIVAENICKAYESRYVLANVCFRLSHDDRVGLVGANGEGKTTLLRIVADMDQATTGEVQRSRDLRIGYLPQDPPVSGEVTLWQAMLDAVAGIRAMEAELARMAEGLGDPAHKNERLRRYDEMQAEFEARGGYTYETRIKTVLSGLGFCEDQYAAPLTRLSGGQRNRALLASLLLQEPDVLLLDEPTNHLDIEAVEWLEYWLQSFQGSLVIVSHDRYFLDRTTNKTWEIAFSRLEEYRGNYTAYLTQRELRYNERLQQWEAQQEYVERTEEFIRRHLAGQRTKEAQGRRTRLERYLRDEAVERPREHQRIRVRLTFKERSGDLILKARSLTIGYDPEKPLLDIPDLEVRSGERIALVGANGTGKTTLVRTILGEVPPLCGTVKLGANIVLGYLAQTHENLDPQMTVLDAVQKVREGQADEKVRTLLGGFLFRGDDVFKRIGELSGGQRSRVVLARLVVQGANVLFLDEPTNHLDIPSQEVLQDVLQGFEGTLIFVSHDRYLIQALATHVWAFDASGFHPMKGNWDEYLRWRGARAESARQADAPAQEERRVEREAARATVQRRRQAAKLERKKEELEKAIAPLERRLQELSDGIGKAGEEKDMARLRGLSEEYGATDSQLKALWDQWTDIVEALEAGPADGA